jgi:tetratricopeptide (TPR) repeat protein
MTHAELDAHWSFSDPAASEAAFRGLLGNTGSMAPAARTQIARALGLQGRFAEGHAELDQAQDLPTDETTRCRILLERGRLMNSSGSPAEAEPLFVEAMGVEGAEDFYRVDAAHMAAICSGGHHASALEMASGSADPRARSWEGSILNNWGWDEFDAGRAPEALAIFERAVEARRRHGQEARLLPAEWAVARCLRELGRFREALEIQDRLALQDPSDRFAAEEQALLLDAIGEGARPA